MGKRGEVTSEGERRCAILWRSEGERKSVKAREKVERGGGRAQTHKLIRSRFEAASQSLELALSNS